MDGMGAAGRIRYLEMTIEYSSRDALTRASVVRRSVHRIAIAHVGCVSTAEMARRRGQPVEASLHETQL